jgi:hypothetical protein
MRERARGDMINQHLARQEDISTEAHESLLRFLAHNRMPLPLLRNACHQSDSNDLNHSASKQTPFVATPVIAMQPILDCISLSNRSRSTRIE